MYMKNNKVVYGLGSLLVISGVTTFVFFGKWTTVSSQLNGLQNDYVVAQQKINELDQAIRAIQDEKAKIEAEKNATAQKLATTKQSVDALTDKVAEVSKEARTLEKLKELDPQLLQKYSKVYFLNEHYTPRELSLVQEKYLANVKKPVQILLDVRSHMEEMLDEAETDGVDIKVVSGYRSFSAQEALKSNYKVIYGAGTANQFSADQGYSEHQLGTTIDLTSPGVGSGLEGFEKTPAYDWLLKHAFHYGFILSYPQGNKYYQFEPWHWRFVGVSLSRALHRDKINFYDMDQREINEYLGKIFDN